MTTPLTKHQIAALREVSKRPGEFFAPGPSMKSLLKRGLISGRFIGMRWWKFALSEEGRIELALIDSSDWCTTHAEDEGREVDDPR